MKHNRLVIYDFDGTLFNSPNRETGEIAYFEATGKEFPFQGWWGRLESLMPPIVPEKPGTEWLIPKPVASYREDRKNPNSQLVLMTGRPFKNRKRIIEICDSHDIKFDKYFFRGQPGQKGRDTLEIKCNFIQELIHPKLEILEIWEDRPEHVSAFFNFSKILKKNFNNLKTILIHDVLNS